MILRQLAGRVTGTAVSTVRFAAGIPLGVARSVLERVIPHGDDSTSAPDATSATDTGAAARESAAEQAAATPAPTSDDAQRATTSRTGAPKSGTADEQEPEVVLSIDAPPEEIEPPVDVVGEALAAEQEQAAERPDEPQPVHVPEETEVVYSTASDEDRG